MGNFVGSPRIGSHQTDLYRVGLDLGVSQFRTVPGQYTAQDAASWRQGQILMFSTANELMLSDGNNVLGMAKWNKTTQLLSAAVDEPIVFPTAGSAVTLAHPNISNFAVRSAVLNGGTQYVVTTDYTLNTTNGVVTQVALGSIPLNTTVYASYTWQLTAQQMADQGFNWFNSNDQVTLGGRKIALITGHCTVYTLEYDTSRQYALQGATSNLYVNSSSILTNNSSSARFCGKVIQLPSAAYPYLGCELDFAAAGPAT